MRVNTRYINSARGTSSVHRYNPRYTRGTSVEKSPSIKVHRVTDPLLLLFSIYVNNFSQTVGEMVFVSFKVEKMRMFLVQSIVHWCWVLVQSWGAVVSFPMCRIIPISPSQLAEL